MGQIIPERAAPRPSGHRFLTVSRASRDRTVLGEMRRSAAISASETAGP
ncbi:hypothetical protein O1Q96_06565 [Streptomyces sp. Qhu-G9]|nr:hypothetical protein [Streptomyces aurantiacus]WAU79441.1 hypothetical protein O1Q96_06565 [Streptomyces aurantiacus]